MPRLLLLVIGFALSGAVKKMIVGAGLGLLSMSFIQALFKWYIERFTHYGQFDNSTNVMGLLAIAMIPECVSVILGAVVARVSINAMSLALTKK
ncbi:DUF2523 family protein [Acinetobacter puyangensis]|uniref:DUF2523 family protein n=1 Tax=Acinetobacter puyangensis TaxID=1096779 RepID=UPI003A4E0258